MDAGSASNRLIGFQLLNSILALNSNVLTSSFKMYLMPARETLNLKWNENTFKEVESVSIYDLRGVLVLNENIIINNSDFSVNTSIFKKGIYLVKIVGKDGKTIFTDKFVKE